jgi:hypothetical protein
MSESGDDDTLTVKADLEEKTLTIRGRKLETVDIFLILATVVVITLGAFEYGVV